MFRLSSQGQTAGRVKVKMHTQSHLAENPASTHDPASLIPALLRNCLSQSAGVQPAWVACEGLKSYHKRPGLRPRPHRRPRPNFRCLLQSGANSPLPLWVL